MSIILSVWTIVVFVLIIAIGLWAWSSKNEGEFDAAARIPFDDDDERIPTSEDLNNG